jgi:hypothetical protein
MGKPGVCGTSREINLGIVPMKFSESKNRKVTRLAIGANTIQKAQPKLGCSQNIASLPES